ncbi:MAG: hypothetical protein ACR2RE_22385 [Geminicoccaceae bacterium]
MAECQILKSGEIRGLPFEIYTHNAIVGWRMGANGERVEREYVLNAPIVSASEIEGVVRVCNVSMASELKDGVFHG